MTEPVEHRDRLPGGDPPLPFTPRPVASRPVAPREPGPAPQVNPNALAHAARDAVLDVLPEDWHRLPDGRDVSILLAGTLANRYSAEQQAQAERLAAAADRAEAEADHG